MDAELEGTEVGGLVQALHLLSHERLMDRLALGIGSIDCGAEGACSSAGARTRRRERLGREKAAARIRTIGTDRIQELKENALDFGPVFLRHLVSVARAATLV